MAKRFGRARQEQNPPIHFPSWDEGEHIQLRPVRTWRMELEARQAQIDVPLAELEMMAEEERRAYLAEHADVTGYNRSLMLAMVESHTFTNDDGAPLEFAGLIDQFSADELGFILTEINKRDGSFRIPETELGDFRSAGASGNAGELPAAGASVDDATLAGGAGDTSNGLDTGRRAQAAKRALGAVPGGVGPAGGG